MAIIDMLLPKTPVRIYIHICALYHYEEILKEIVSHLMKNILNQPSVSLYYGILGSANSVENVQDILYPLRMKTFLLGHSLNTYEYERYTLNFLYQHAKQEDFYVFYLHTKGITRMKYPGVRGWRNLMMYYCNTFAPVCISLLDQGYQATGALFRSRPMRHFSGNFWWSRSDYIRTLPARIGLNRLDPEMWIGRKLTKYHNLFNIRRSPQACYRMPIHVSTFRNQIIKPETPIIFRSTITRAMYGIWDEWIDVTHECLTMLPNRFTVRPQLFVGTSATINIKILIIQVGEDGYHTWIDGDICRLAKS